MKRNAWFIAVLSLATIVVGGCNEDNTDTGCEPLLGSSHEPYSVITTFAGNGVQGQGTDGVCPLKTALYWPQDLAFSPDGKAYIIDWNNYRIRVVENGLMHTVIGSGNPVPDGES
jgi:NHL repeat-containing protein